MAGRLERRAFVEPWGVWWAAGARFDGDLLGRGLAKLAVGLNWLINGDRLTSDIVFEHHEGLLASQYNGTARYRFGDALEVVHAQVPEDRRLQIFDVTFFGRAAWALSFMPQEVAEWVARDRAARADK
jgi:hypothetical protein